MNRSTSRLLDAEIKLLYILQHYLQPRLPKMPWAVGFSHILGLV